MKLQLPLPSAVTCPIGLPLPSVRVTLLPGSAVPLSVVPLLGLITGVAGATESTVTLLPALVLPEASVAVALTTVPLGNGVVGVKLQLPLPSAVTCPMGLPLPSVRVTVAPGSAVPLSVVPLLGLTTGVAGATASTVTLAGELALPDGSVAVALTTVPLGNGVLGVKVQLPLPSAVTWPIGLPLPSVRVTVAPGSAVPLRVVPLLLLGLILMVVIYIVARVKKLPAMPRVSLREWLASARKALWGLLLMVIILGGIYSGAFTPTEAAAVAAVYSAFVALFVYRDMRLSECPKVLLESGKLTIMLMFIIANAMLFAHVLTTEQIPQSIASWVTELGLSPWMFLLVVNIVLLIAGNFMEPSAIILILAPIFFPIAMELGIDPIHLGIIMVVNMEIGLITPPVGLNLFVTSAGGAIRPTGQWGARVGRIAARGYPPGGVPVRWRIALGRYSPYGSMGRSGRANSRSRLSAGRGTGALADSARALFALRVMGMLG